MDPLRELGIDSENCGSCTGKGKWNDSNSSVKIDSINPSTGENIASVYECSVEEAETVIKASAEAFSDWRTVPAPVRGQLVREMADAIRLKKDALGSLVSMEVGKIKQEGDGEVQEMIEERISDFTITRDRDELFRDLQQAGVTAGPVLSAADAIANPLPIAAVVFPTASNLSVLSLTSDGNSAISAIPPALSEIGP